MSKKKSKMLPLLRLAALPVASAVWFPAPARADVFLFGYVFNSEYLWDYSSDSLSNWYDTTTANSFPYPTDDASTIAVIGNGGYDVAGVTDINVAYNHNVGNNGIGSLYIDSGNSLSQPDNTHLEASEENLGVEGSGALYSKRRNQHRHFRPFSRS